MVSGQNFCILQYMIHMTVFLGHIDMKLIRAGIFIVLFIYFYYYSAGTVHINQHFCKYAQVSQKACFHSLAQCYYRCLKKNKTKQKTPQNFNTNQDKNRDKIYTQKSGMSFR